jgi:hypothetical protein
MTGAPAESSLIGSRPVLERVLLRFLIVGQVRPAILLGELRGPRARGLLCLAALHFVRAQLFLRIEIPPARIAAELVRSRTGW